MSGEAAGGVRAALAALRDPAYRDFQCRLMPTVPPERVLGVRTPQLRKLAASLSGTEEAESFLAALPHDYYEENNLHAFLLERVRDLDRCLREVDRFLPYVDNWATCDSMSPKVFAKNLPALLPWIQGWLASDRPYTVRFGVEMLMSFYLDGAFQPEYLAWVAALPGELLEREYYVHMMVAWYFATALYKQPQAALPYLTERRLPAATHNKTIQKAVESRRITPAQKDYLRSLRMK